MGAVRGPARATGKGGTKEHDMPDREPIAEQMLVERAEWRSIGDAIFDHTGRS